MGVHTDPPCIEAGSEARSDHEIERSAKDARFKQEIIDQKRLLNAKI
jgi:hypothetical protein